MNQPRPRGAAVFWWWLTAIVATALYIVADSNAVYEATSPSGLSFHVVLRKFYSIVAFAVVGFCFAKARKIDGASTSLAAVGALVGAYSLAIEITQFFLGPPEGLGWNVADIAMGVVGGILGAVAVRHTAAASSTPRRLS